MKENIEVPQILLKRNTDASLDYHLFTSDFFFLSADEWKYRHKTTYKLPISKEVTQIMYSRLKEEYQFYMFIRQRFQRVYKAIENARTKLKLR